MGDVSDRRSSTTIVEEDDGMRGLKISVVKNEEEFDQFSVAETISLEELKFFTTNLTILGVYKRDGYRDELRTEAETPE